MLTYETDFLSRPFPGIIKSKKLGKEILDMPQSPINVNEDLTHVYMNLKKLKSQG